MMHETAIKNRRCRLMKEDYITKLAKAEQELHAAKCVISKLESRGLWARIRNKGVGK